MTQPKATTPRFVKSFDGKWTPELEEAVLQQMVAFIEEEADEVGHTIALPLERTLTKESLKAFMQGKKTFGELIGLSAKEAYSFSAFGHSYLEMSRFAEAEAIFKGLVVMAPKDAYHHASLALLYQRKEQNAEAIAEYSAALLLDPKSVDARLNRGELLLLAGKLKEGVDDLVAVLSDVPETDTSPKFQRARALCAATQKIIKDARAKK